ncbi:MAG: leucine-rich repeat domain-containing protein [Bacteroidales bacterium]|nr:leucine-rich repeat domain-containing protein [Bacteroidales bacterium]
MRKFLLLFFAMLFVSIGTWAITITEETAYIGGGQYTGGTKTTGYGIYGAKAGEIALLLNGTFTGTIRWNGATLADLTSAEYIKVGSSSNPSVLNDDDLEALALLSGAKYLDIDGSTLAEGADISKIEAGSAIEGVSLPNNLTKEQVNAAGAALSAYPNFGSCLSLDAEMAPKDIKVYTVPCTGEEVEYTGTVTNGQGHIDNLARPLTLTSASASFVNTKFNDEVTPVDPNRVENGKVVPNPLKVELTKLDNPVNSYSVTYKGITKEVSANEVGQDEQGNYILTSSPYWQEIPPYGENVPAGTPVTATSCEYSYTFFENYSNQTKYYSGTAEGNETTGYYAMVKNVYEPNKSGYQFDADASYNYTYIDLDCNEQTVSYTDGPHETIDLPYNQDVTLSTKTINAPKEGGNATVVAYVNTPGTLYKATSLDVNDCAEADALVVSGIINNGDIAIHKNAGDPLGTQDQTDHFENTAIAAFYLNDQPASIKSVDMSDAVIENYKYLRVLNAYAGNLESVVFPKTLTKIPNYCCYCGGDDGNKNLSEVVFPTESTSFTIGDYAFHQIAIKNLILPSTVTRVGDYAFERCPELYSVEMEGLKNDCTFGNYVFNQCPALQHVSLSEGVQNIGDYMFNQCVILESIRIPSTCKTIGERAFQFCYDIHQVTIPEGVELIKYNAFEGAGLTDLYIMATSIDKIPKIYAMSTDPESNGGPSTFSYQRTTGNNTIPAYHRSDLPNAEYDDVMTWYQEEQSGAQGLGSGNCLTALHYPESMKPFYEAIDVTEFYSDEELAKIPFFQNPEAQQTGVKKYYTPEEYLAMSKDPTTLTAIVNNVMQEGYNNAGQQAFDFGDTAYEYLPQSYAVDPRKDNSTTWVFGPDKDGRYYPSQTSYQLRMAAGATSSLAGGVAGEEIASAWGWRQFPLSSSIESIGEIPFEKEYDDTWYTMAFPWRMIDNQLFAAFNQQMEIVEFVGAEVLDVDNTSTENVKEYSLVFHFEDVAKTFYMDQEDNFYKRELDEIRDITSNGVTIHKKFYKYTLLDGKDGNETTTVITDPWPYDAGSASVTDREKHAKYLSIENIMVLAGHPYMIHPSIGASPGNPVKVYINGVKKIVPGEGLYENYSSLAAVAEANKVVRTVSSRTRTRTYNEDGTVTDTYSGPEVWTNPETGAGGKYYFIGNINDAIETVDETSGEVTSSDYGKKDLPKGCYYLGVPDGDVYPKYFKRKSVGTNLWSQYSAIILPDADALANVEGLNGMTVKTPSGGQAKGATMEIGAWDFNDMTIVDDISPIIDEALEKDKSAKILHMNVVYNIKGQVVRADSGSVEGLPKGIYIVNGKKYMIK